MPRRSVAVVAAMRRELAPLLRGVRPLRADGVEFFEFETAVVAIGGIGRTAARRATEAVVAKYAPSVIVSAGIAGALSSTLKVGDVVQAKVVVDADSGARFTTSGGEAVIATVSSVSGPAEKQMLAARWKADVVDMEAAAVAAVALGHAIEFMAIKAISDELDFAMPPVAEFTDDTGRFQAFRFAMYVAVRPKWWKVVRQLNSGSHIAAANLSEALNHLIDHWSQALHEEKISGA